jgi:hypothetical protein
VAAAIECNMAVGNVFAEHVSNLNADLHDRLSSRYDFATFMDSTIDSSTAMVDLFDPHQPESAAQ